MKFKIFAVGMLVIGILAGCGTEADTENKTESTSNSTEQKQEKKVSNQKGLGQVGEYGKVTVISEAEPFVLEGNENVNYELSDVKVIKLEDYTEDGEWGLLWATGAEDVEQLPESVYAVIGTEAKTNKTDVSIEFTGVHTMVAGTEQVDIIMDDFALEDEGGSTMLSGVEMDGQFAVIIENPEVDSLKFVLSNAFDSETFSTDFLTEQEIELPLTKK